MLASAIPGSRSWEESVFGGQCVPRLPTHPRELRSGSGGAGGILPASRKVSPNSLARALQAGEESGLRGREHQGPGPRPRPGRPPVPITAACVRAPPPLPRPQHLEPRPRGRQPGSEGPSWREDGGRWGQPSGEGPGGRDREGGPRGAFPGLGLRGRLCSVSLCALCPHSDKRLLEGEAPRLCTVWLRGRRGRAPSATLRCSNCHRHWRVGNWPVLLCLDEATVPRATEG